MLITVVHLGCVNVSVPSDEKGTVTEEHKRRSSDFGLQWTYFYILSLQKEGMEERHHNIKKGSV